MLFYVFFLRFQAAIDFHSFLHCRNIIWVIFLTRNMFKLCKECITGTFKKVTDWIFEYIDIETKGCLTMD